MVAPAAYARAEITGETAVRSMPPLRVSDRAPGEAVPEGNALQAQPQLRAGGSRGTEQRGVQRVARGGIEVQAAAGEVETVPEQQRIGAGAAHARAEIRIVCAPPAHGANPPPHLVRPPRARPRQAIR